MKEKNQHTNLEYFKRFRVLIPICMAFMLMWSTGMTVLAEEGDGISEGEITAQEDADSWVDYDVGADPGGGDSSDDGGGSSGGESISQDADSGGDEGSGADSSADSGAGDIAEDTSVALEANPGSAEVAEVITESNGSESNTVTEAEAIENDVPSVTVTETFESVTLQGDEKAEDKIKNMDPAGKTYALTEGGDTIKEEDREKVDLSKEGNKVEVTEGNKTEKDGTTTVDKVTRTTVTSSDNAIQKAVNEALKKVTADTKSITVTVAAGKYDGDVNISDEIEIESSGSSGSKTALKDILASNKGFKLYILGEGSYTKPEDGGIIDKSKITTDSGQDVLFGGNFNIQGINTVLAGIWFSLHNSIKVSGGADVTVYGTSGDDGIDATMTGGDNALSIDTGEGNDTVKASTAKEKTDEDDTGSDDQQKNFSNKLTVNTGDGNDTVSLNHAAGVLEAEVTTGNGEDKAELKAGDDAVSSYKNNSDGNGNDTGSEETVKGSLKVELGEGDDTANVDASLVKGFADDAVSIDGGAGYNIMNLSGKLAKDKDGQIAAELTKTVSGDEKTYAGSISMIPDGKDDAGKIGLTGFQFFTDNLENKKSEKINSLDKVTPKSFVNYSIEADEDDQVAGDWSAYSDLILTNLDISGDEVHLGKLNIPSVNLKVKAKKILVEGAVTALDINLITKDDDVTFDISDDVPSIVSDKLGDQMSGSLFDFNAEAGIDVKKDGSLTATSGDVNMSAEIDQTHKLFDLLGGWLDKLNKLDDDLEVVSKALQVPNTFNIKVGRATISVNGGIDAKRYFNASSKSNVSMEASNKDVASLYIPVSFVVAVTETAIEMFNAAVKAGRDIILSVLSNDSLKAEATTGKLPISLATAVAVNDGHILIGGTTKMVAGGDVKMDTKASTTAEASAKRGELKSDSSGYLAVEVAVQDAYTRVEDSASITAGGNIELNSSANLKGKAHATSAKAEGEKDDDGGEDKKDDDKKSAGTLLSGVTELLKKLGEEYGKKALKTGYGWVKNKLTGAADLVSSKQYKVTAEESDHGSVSAPASANGHKSADTKTFEEGVTYYTLVKDKFVKATDITPGEVIPKETNYYVDADPVRLVITPNKGYKVKEITVTYLLKGAKEKTKVTISGDDASGNNEIGLKRNADGSFSYRMPEADVKVSVEFEKGESGATPEEETTDAGLSDLFNESTGNTAPEEDPEEQQEDSTSPDAVTLEIEETDGSYQLTKDEKVAEGTTYYTKVEIAGDTVMTKVTGAEVGDDIPKGEDGKPEYYEEIGAILLSVTKADPNSFVTVTPNPAADKAMKNLKAVYKSEYQIETEKKFDTDKRTYYLLVAGEFVKQEKEQGVENGKKIPSGKTYYYTEYVKAEPDKPVDANTKYYVFVEGSYIEKSLAGKDKIPDDNNYYYLKQRDVETEVTANEAGAYKFRVPYGVVGKISFIAEFGDATGAEMTPAKPDDAASAQSAGALAGGVNINTNEAAISTTGKIEAGGSVTVNASGTAEASVVADGTAVGKDDEEKKEGPGGTTPEGATQITAEQTIVPYTVYTAPAKKEGASLKSLADSDPEKGVYVFKVVGADKDFTNDEGKVTFTYTDSDGKEQTGKAKLDKDNAQYTVDLSSLSIKAGTTVTIRLEGIEADADAKGSWLVGNTVKIDSTQNGAVNLLSGKAGSKVFAFSVTPRVGYRLGETTQKKESEDGKESGSGDNNKEEKEETVASLFVKYTKADGTEGKVALKDGGKGNYYFKIADLKDLKEGSELIVTAEFVKNVRDIALSVKAGGADEPKAGTITLDSSTINSEAEGDKKATAIEGNTVKFSINSGAGHTSTLAKVYVSYTLDGEETKKELQIKDGKYSFVMPNTAVTITADFYNQIHSVVFEEKDLDEENKNLIQTSSEKVGAGETFKIYLKEEQVKQQIGYY